MSIVSSRGADQYMLRFPAGMRDQLKAAASAGGRSLNAEIIHRLLTWREPSAAPGSPIAMSVDASQVKEALYLVQQLQHAAEQAGEACRKLGIKTVGA